MKYYSFPMSPEEGDAEYLLNGEHFTFVLKLWFHQTNEWRN